MSIDGGRGIVLRVNGVSLTFVSILPVYMLVGRHMVCHERCNMSTEAAQHHSALFEPYKQHRHDVMDLGACAYENDHLQLAVD